MTRAYGLGTVVNSKPQSAIMPQRQIICKGLLTCCRSRDLRGARLGIQGLHTLPHIKTPIEASRIARHTPQKLPQRRDGRSRAALIRRKLARLSAIAADGHRGAARRLPRRELLNTERSSSHSGNKFSRQRYNHLLGNAAAGSRRMRECPVRGSSTKRSPAYIRAFRRRQRDDHR